MDEEKRGQIVRTVSEALDLIFKEYGVTAACLVLFSFNDGSGLYTAGNVGLDGMKVLCEMGLDVREEDQIDAGQAIN